MGRPSWATDEQLVFLESRLLGLDLAKKTHSLASEYKIIAQDFMKTWPTKPTNEEREAVSDPQQLQATADVRRARVSHCSAGHCYPNFLTIFASKYRIGTKPAERPAPRFSPRNYWISQAGIRENQSHTSYTTPTQSATTSRKILHFAKWSETFGNVEKKSRSSINYPLT